MPATACIARSVYARSAVRGVPAGHADRLPAPEFGFVCTAPASPQASRLRPPSLSAQLALFVQRPASPSGLRPTASPPPLALFGTPAMSPREGPGDLSPCVDTPCPPGLALFGTSATCRNTASRWVPVAGSQQAGRPRLGRLRNHPRGPVCTMFLSQDPGPLASDTHPRPARGKWERRRRHLRRVQN